MLNNAKHQAKNSPSLPILGYDGIALKLSKQIRVRKRYVWKIKFGWTCLLQQATNKYDRFWQNARPCMSILGFKPHPIV